MSDRRRGGPHSLPRLRDGLLTIGAIFGTLCLLSAAVCLVFGLRPLVFQSGSMSPSIPAGSLALARTVEADALAVGDVVSVFTAEGHRVTHRVVRIDPAPDRTGRYVLTLRGDANANADAEPYVVTTADRVVLDVPLLGYPVSWVSTPLGLIGLGAVAAGLLLFAFRRTSAHPRGGRRRVAMSATSAAALLAVGATAQPTAASWSDLATVNAAFSTHPVISQAQPGCQNVDGLLTLGNLARLTWSQVDAKYEYYWELRLASNGSVANSGTVGGGVTQGQTVTLDISTGLIGTNGNYNVVVRARLVNSPTWVAPTTTTTPVRRASVLVLGLAMRCGHG